MATCSHCTARPATHRAVYGQGDWVRVTCTTCAPTFALDGASLFTLSDGSEYDPAPAARAAVIADECDTYVSPAALAAESAAAPCTHWECALMGSACVESGAPAMMPPRTPRTYTARRIAARFYEYTGADEYTPGDDFNVDATPYDVRDDVQEFDTMADLVAAVRRDGVTFAATGTDWAADPDGSFDIDFATGAREAVSWHFDGIAPAMLARVIMPAVDAR